MPIKFILKNNLHIHIREILFFPSTHKFITVPKLASIIIFLSRWNFEAA